MAAIVGRRGVRTVLAWVAASGILLAGCGSGEDGAVGAAPTRVSGSSSATPSSAAASAGQSKPGILRDQHVRQVLPDAAAMPGWKNLGPILDEDNFMCEAVAGDTCQGVKSSGTTNFTRGPKTLEQFVRVAFTLYSCRSDSAATEFYEALRISGTKSSPLGSLGDQRSAWREKIGEQEVMHAKVRMGDTVLWVFITGTEQTATGDQVSKMMRLLSDRTQQVKDGAAPTARLAVE